MDIVIFIAAMAVLVYGADLVIKQSEKIAFHFNISEFVIGATLIAVGTSLPEMAASISASMQNKDDMAVSNIIGSNIMNITLVLGLVFLISKPIKPSRDMFSSDSAWLVLPLFIFIAVLYDGVVTRFEGVMLGFIMAAYLLFLHANKAKAATTELDLELKTAAFRWTSTLFLLLLGFLSVTGGAHFAIESASNIAVSFGVSEWIVGLILVSLGTSLPELVVSIVAAMKNKADMAIGNIIGSNLANVAVAVAGAALVSPLAVDVASNMFDIFIMVIATFTLVFIMANRFYNKAAGIILLIILGVFLQNIIQTL
ncbi:MAG: calcium/sodium antiporter [Campylobacterota bacterium]